MQVSEEIEARLRAAFEPSTLSVVDEGEMHRGHAGYQEGGQSHFRVEIAAAVFEPMTRIERHRAVHEALGEELVGRIHALALHISG